MFLVIISFFDALLSFSNLLHHANQLDGVSFLYSNFEACEKKMIPQFAASLLNDAEEGNLLEKAIFEELCKRDMILLHGDEKDQIIKDVAFRVPFSRELLNLSKTELNNVVLGRRGEKRKKKFLSDFFP